MQVASDNLVNAGCQGYLDGVQAKIIVLTQRGYLIQN